MADAYLLDTNIASIVWDGENPNHHVICQRVADLGEDSISVCSISIGEVEYGLQVSPAIDMERHQAARQAMMQYQIWEIDRHTGTYYGQIRGGLFKRYAPRNARGRLTTKPLKTFVIRQLAGNSVYKKMISGSSASLFNTIFV